MTANKSRKYVVVLCDGMADYADEGGNTPMTLAAKPNMDALAAVAEVGLCQTVPAGMKPGSDVANLSVMGYDPRQCYTGRSPLEAISIGIPLSDQDVTYRCNLVSLSGNGAYETLAMADYSAGEISTEEARELISFLAQKLPLQEEGLRLYTGVSYRHCLVRTQGQTGAVLTPPHDISDKPITEHLPTGAYAADFLRLMRLSYELLKDHPVNIARRKKGLNTADSVWFWGEGRKPKLDNFAQKFGIRGAVISAVDLIKGIGLGAGMQSIDVEGATGTVHTNFDGKAQAAVRALETNDFVYIHLEAPDECGHQGDKAGKILSIERIDQKILAPVRKALECSGAPYKILVIPDHATPIVKKTHTSDPVPYLLYDSTRTQTGVRSLNEFTAKQTGTFVPFGFDLLPKMLGD